MLDILRRCGDEERLRRGTQGNEGIICQNGGNAGLTVAIGGPGAGDGNTLSGYGGAAIFVGQVAGQGSVVSMGVFIGQSTKILDRATGEILYGRVPSGSVVVPGSLPSADGSHSLYCAVIVKTVDAQTRAKTGINDLLRD
mgnify:CR=1 FL=1